MRHIHLWSRKPDLLIIFASSNPMVPSLRELIDLALPNGGEGGIQLRTLLE